MGPEETCDTASSLRDLGTLVEEGAARAGSRSASSGGASPPSSLAVSVGLHVNVFYKMQAITSSHGMLCLILHTPFQIG